MKKTIQNPDPLLEFLKNTPAHYFDVKADTTTIYLRTRENGSVGDEGPGEEDIEAAMATCISLKKNFLSLKQVMKLAMNGLMSQLIYEILMSITSPKWTRHVSRGTS